MPVVRLPATALTVDIAPPPTHTHTLCLFIRPTLTVLRLPVAPNAPRMGQINRIRTGRLVSSLSAPDLGFQNQGLDKPGRAGNVSQMFYTCRTTGYSNSIRPGHDNSITNIRPGHNREAILFLEVAARIRAVRRARWAHSLVTRQPPPLASRQAYRGQPPLQYRAGA